MLAESIVSKAERTNTLFSDIESSVVRRKGFVHAIRGKLSSSLAISRVAGVESRAVQLKRPKLTKLLLSEAE
jgi:hypothetical protein